MKRTITIVIQTIVLLLITITVAGAGTAEISEDRATRKIIDSYGNSVLIPDQVGQIICSGAGALRLAVYLQVIDRVIAVDDMEGRRSNTHARPYALAYPELQDLPLFGAFRGDDSPELILGLDPQPQVVFKTFPESGVNPQELEAKTGIPVVALSYGDLLTGRDDLYGSLRIMGEVLGVSAHAEAVIAFIESHIFDLKSRCSKVVEATCYIGGVAKKGLQGITSTEISYPPFIFTGANQLPDGGEHTVHTVISREQLIDWNPDILFIDVSSLMLQDTSNVLYELQNREYYRNLKAVRNGMVYGLLPYNLYTQNFGSILADAYFVGSVICSNAFDDIDPAEKADEIYKFLVGKPVFEEMSASFEHAAFQRILP